MYEMVGGRRLHISDQAGNLAGDRSILGGWWWGEYRRYPIISGVSHFKPGNRHDRLVCCHPRLNCRATPPDTHLE